MKLVFLTVILSTASAKSLLDCVPPKNAVLSFWTYDDKDTMSAAMCTDKHDTSGTPWIMLNAYRSGGKKEKHWDTKSHMEHKMPEWCLMNWAYYERDGTTLIGRINGTTTWDRKETEWCPYVVYRRGGVRGYEWDYCDCPSEWPPPPPPATTPPPTLPPPPSPPVRTPRPKETQGK